MDLVTDYPFTGRLVEDMENKIRNTLNEIYFGKTKDIVNGLRSVLPLADANKTRDLQVKLSFYYYLSLSSSYVIIMTFTMFICRRSFCKPFTKRMRARPTEIQRTPVHETLIQSL